MAIALFGSSAVMAGAQGVNVGVWNLPEAGYLRAKGVTELRNQVSAKPSNGTTVSASSTLEIREGVRLEVSPE